MKTYIYEVHDEDGKLRVFYSLHEAQRFAGEHLKVVRVQESREPKRAVDLTRFEPAPF